MQAVRWQAVGRLEIATRGKGLYDITNRVNMWLEEQGVQEGLLTLFIRHTSASLTIQENADPDVQADLLAAFERLAPEFGPYRHTMEGPDDMPAHIRTSLTDVSLSIPLQRGVLDLGTWQGVYLFEHRTAAHSRSISLHVLGC